MEFGFWERTQAVPFRAGKTARAPEVITPGAALGFTGPTVLLADISEFQPSIADAAYVAWSPAIVIRAAYGAAHDDGAWYGGQRRAALHAAGVRFLGIYQYLVNGEDGGVQADVLAGLLGRLQPGEVLIADDEEVSDATLTAWYNRLLAHGYPHPQLWTYSGEYYAQSHGLTPEWVAAYGQGEPTVPHRLWQFTDAYQVPGVGTCDCSVFHGTVDQLAALAYQPVPVPAPTPSAPPAPAHLRSLSGRVVEAVQAIAWDAVPGAASYRVTATDKNGTVVDDLTVAGTSCTLHHLIPGWSYRVAVQALPGGTAAGLTVVAAT